MKRIGFMFVLLMAAVLGFGQQAKFLDGAIDDAVTYLNGKFPAGTAILLLDTRSAFIDADDVAKYATTQLKTKLVNAGKLRLADRSPARGDEIDYQLRTGNVSDETIQGIGHEIGAEYVVWGKIDRFGPKYTLYLDGVSLRTAIVEASKPIEISEDAKLKSMIKEQPKDYSQYEIVNENTGGRPRWASEPKWYGMLKYENKYGNQDSPYTYLVIDSSNASSIALAQQNSDQKIAMKLVDRVSAIYQNVMSSKILGITEPGDELEQVQIAISEASKVARARPPQYEVLETFITKGPQNRRKQDTYILTSLVRVSTKDLSTAIQGIDTGKIETELKEKAEKLRGSISGNALTALMNVGLEPEEAIDYLNTEGLPK